MKLMKSKKIIAIFCLSFILTNFVGCTPKKEVSESTKNNSSATENLQSIETSVNDNTKSHNIEGMFSNRDMDIDYDNSVIINLSDSGITSRSESVKISGTTAVITDEGTYRLQGNLSDGQIIVEAEKTDTIQLVLDGVTLNSNNSAPIYIKQARKVIITLANDSKNTLSTRDDFISIGDNDIDAVIYSHEDVTLNGNGSLAITTKDGKGIISDKNLIFTGGNYEVTSKSHGLVGTDNVKIANGTFTIMSEKDGIKTENDTDASMGFIYIENGSFNITVEGDALDASSNLQINNGDFSIKTGGGSQNPTSETDDSPSTKALKSDSDVIIHGGTFNIDSFDDSIHANKDVSITNGNFTLSSGDDAIHADASLSISDGTINILDSYEGIEGLTVDIMGGNIDVTARDDGINAAGGTGDPNEECYINISGGHITIHSTGVYTGEDSTGGDAIDANGDLIVTGGEIYISGTTSSRDGALDFDDTGTISGGLLVAAGDSSMAQNFSDTSTQGTILVNSQRKQTGAIKLQDSKGNELLSYTPKNAYNSVVISTPDIKKGETYIIVMGTESQTVEMENIIFGESSRRGRGRPPR